MFPIILEDVGLCPLFTVVGNWFTVVSITWFAVVIGFSRSGENSTRMVGLGQGDRVVGIGVNHLVDRSPWNPDQYDGRILVVVGGVIGWSVWCTTNSRPRKCTPLSANPCSDACVSRSSLFIWLVVFGFSAYFPPGCFRFGKVYERRFNAR